MATQHIGRIESKLDEWNAFVFRFLMHHSQENQRHARRINMLETAVLEMCKDAPPTASFALHKVASDLRAEVQKHAAEGEASLTRVEELAAMAYKFLSHQEQPAQTARPGTKAPAKNKMPPAKSGAPSKKRAKKKR